MMEKTRSAASANPGLPAIGILRRGFRMNFPEAAALFTSSRALLVFIGSSEHDSSSTYTFLLDSLYFEWSSGESTRKVQVIKPFENKI